MSLLRGKGRTFALDMASDGAASLQKVILKKLTEFMGDYSDDVLAQYILVLVAHGKQQAQTVKDLEAFLGDRSESFVAWLWDYLSSNLHLHESVSKAPVVGGNGVEHKVEQADNWRVKSVQADVQVTSLENKILEKRTHMSSTARNIPDLNDPPPKVGQKEVQSGRSKGEAKNKSAAKHSRHEEKQLRPSLNISTQKERERVSDEKHHRKRHASPPSVNATRRLLQSAVREAVGPVVGVPKSGSKRLRSVVLTESDDLEDRGMHNSMVKVDDVREGNIEFSTLPVSNKAAALIHQEDTGIVGSVWNRLGASSKYSRDEYIDCDLDSQAQRIVYKRMASESTCLDDEGQFSEDFNKRNGHAAEKPLAERARSLYQVDNPVQLKEANALNHFGSQHFQTSDNEDMIRMGTGPSTLVSKESKKMCHVNGLVRSINPDSRQLHFSEKHATCSQGERPESSQLEQLQTQLARSEGDSLKDVRELKKRLDQIQMEMMKLRAKQVDPNKGPQSAILSALPGTEEVSKLEDTLQSRTIFVTNIHFAATKETIMAHFAQCGKVDQVVMLNDVATGKSKGSAYVEFSAKAEAEKALALNETSFYSRILKVAETDSSSIQEMVSCQSASTRHGGSSSFRPSIRGRFFQNAHSTAGFASKRPTYATPTKLQWKRDSTTGGSPSVVNGFNPAVQGVSTRPAVKSYTYVRNPNAPTVKAGCFEGQKGSM